MEIEDLRPPGSVEVRCCHPGCGVAWWIDPLDPRLPGPFDCGDDHNRRFSMERSFALVKARHGYYWGIQGSLTPDAGNCCFETPAAGYAVFYNRTRQQEGLLLWHSPQELRDPEVIAASIQWGDRSQWPEMARKPDPPALLPTAPGHVHWVGYRLPTGEVRRYTFAPCARCGLLMMLDVDDPDVQPEEYGIGGYGGGECPIPEWLGTRTFYCGQGLGTIGAPQPCMIIHGTVLAEYEATTGQRWTIWSGAGRWGHTGSVLFFDPQTEGFGLLRYRNLDPFQTVAELRAAIHWAELPTLHKVLLAQHQQGQDNVRSCLDSILKDLPA